MKTFLPDDTRLSRVHLRTGDLKRAVGFYTGPLGLRVVEQEEHRASIAVKEGSSALIILTEVPGAPVRPDQAIGLFHFAFRYPARRDLAFALTRLAQFGIVPQGASDHIVSEALYLNDPDGNGIELYADRPRSQWIWRGGEVVMATEALDLESLLATTEGQRAPAAVPAQTSMGHIHLHVADLAAAEQFYHEFLGLAVTQRSYPGALFFSAGGYHHHVAVNIWAGNRVPPPDSVGLISYRLEVPEAEILYCLKHRAPLAGYETTTVTENGSELLGIRDLNGNWLEVQYVPTAKTQSGHRRSQPLTNN